MQKQLESFLYTKGRYGDRNLPDYDEDNEYLYANGKYLTNIRKEDLPEGYIEFSSGTIWYRTGYIKTSGIQDIKFVARKNNHLFRDDYIYISYRGKITHDIFKHDYEGFPDYDVHICGKSIFPILLAAEQYSGLDISEIKKQIEEKKNWYRENYSKDYIECFGDKDVDFFEIYK